MPRTPIQSKLTAALEGARTSEPYPVWVTWSTLCRKVYGHASDRNELNLRRIAANANLQTLKYDNGRCAGARFYLSPEEDWLLGWTLEVTNRANYSADYHAYVAPTADEVLLALRTGLAQRRIPLRVNVARAVKIVNEFTGADFDLSETAWSVVKYQASWEEERTEVAQRLASSMKTLHASRSQRERERRMIRVGPFEIDPESQASCPCCLQGMPYGLPAQVRSEAPAARPPIGT
ncbi:hypothetical protein [Streptomyces sp. NPDC058373]|uniref:hypothetical protein n=1 Tax=Streptomyces sp. NPDC058373 TaxID=3346465 RepID=UPI0036475900